MRRRATTSLAKIQMTLILCMIPLIAYCAVYHPNAALLHYLVVVLILSVRSLVADPVYFG